MPFDEFDDAYRTRTWRASPITSFETTVSRLRDALPDFELRPFGAEPDTNPRMRMIVRMPTVDDRFERPVAAVSDKYDLLQHRVLATWLERNMEVAGLGDLMAEVTMSEYGERLRIAIPLGAHEIDFWSDPERSDMYRPEIEVANSVDRSGAMSIVLRLRRLVCLNGMFTDEEDRLRSVHRVDLSRTHVVADFLADRLGKPHTVFDELERWQETPASLEQVEKWGEGWLREKSGWTVKNCARFVAIAKTGYDGTVARPAGATGKIRLSDYRVGQHRSVPGNNFPIKNVYDVAQILTWIASHQRSVEMQMEGTDDVLRLVRRFVEEISS